MTNYQSVEGPKFIPLAVPCLGGKEWEYVKECLDSSWVSSAGNFVARFENMMAAFVGGKYAIATTSGTAALHIALLVAGVKPDHEVLIPSLTFIAPANAVRYVGAWPVFIDVDPNYWQIDLEMLGDFLRNNCETKDGVLVNKFTGRLVKAILPVHLLGHPCDMDPIMELAQTYNLTVVEDATESLGAEYKGNKLGSFGDVACFSFNGNKMVTTGGGGMILTNNKNWADRAVHLTTQAKTDEIEYIHDEIGFNYRLTNIQAALGCAQLEQIENHLESKRHSTEYYKGRLSTIVGLTPMSEAPWAKSANWLFTVVVDQEDFGMDSRSLLRSLMDQRIQSRPLFQPLHLGQAHKDSTKHVNGIAEHINKNALSLPCSVGIDPIDLDRVCTAIESINIQLSGRN